MTADVRVRRVRLHEWREVRDLRIDAVSDPNAAIAFTGLVSAAAAALAWS